MKAGDRVVRIKSDHLGMKVGDTATIEKMEGDNGVRLKEFKTKSGGGSHDVSYLKVIGKVSKLKSVVNSEIIRLREGL